MLFRKKWHNFGAATCHASPVTCHLSPVTHHLFTSRDSVRPCLILQLCFKISRFKRFFKYFQKKWQHFVSHHVKCLLSHVTCLQLDTLSASVYCSDWAFQYFKLSIFSYAFRKSDTILCRYMSCVTCHLSRVHNWTLSPPCPTL